MNRINKDNLEEIVKEVLDELSLDYHVLTVFELQKPPPQFRGKKVWCVKFSEDIEDLTIVLGPGYTEETAGSQARAQLRGLTR